MSTAPQDQDDDEDDEDDEDDFEEEEEAAVPVERHMLGYQWSFDEFPPVGMAKVLYTFEGNTRVVCFAVLSCIVFGKGSSILCSQPDLFPAFCKHFSID